MYLDFDCLSKVELTTLPIYSLQYNVKFTPYFRYSHIFFDF